MTGRSLLRSPSRSAAGLTSPAGSIHSALTGQARADELAAYNLPPEPNPQTQQDLHEFWTELLSTPLRFDPDQFIYAPPPQRVARAAQNVTPRSRQQSSLNWSGASLLAHDGRVFTDVMATWKVPEPKVP